MKTKTGGTEENMGFHSMKFLKSLMTLLSWKAMIRNIPDKRSGIMALGVSITSFT
jgi:hypothetical protein